MAAVQTLLFFLAIVGFMYFLVIRPQRRRQLEMQNLQKSLKPGDEVVTLAGIYGTVTEIEDGGTVLLEVSEDTEIRVAAASIGQVIKDPAALSTPPVSSESPSE